MIDNNPLLGWDNLGQGPHEWWCYIRDLWEKITGAKDKAEEAARTIDNISTAADPNVSLDKKVESVTNIAIEGAQNANRNNEANNIQNFQNSTKNNLTETQNLINKRDNEIRKLLW